MAEGRLLDLIRRLYCFGVSLMKMDVRQESTRHTEALDSVTKYAAPTQIHAGLRSLHCLESLFVGAFSQVTEATVHLPEQCSHRECVFL